MHIGSFSCGFSFGWLSPVLNLLNSTDTPLSSGPLTVVQRAWIGGLLHGMAVLGSLLYGILAPHTGVKRALNLTIFPGIVSSYFFLFISKHTNKIKLSHPANILASLSYIFFLCSFD